VQIKDLELVKYFWYSISLAVFLAWLCRGGWRFKKLDSILFRAEEDEPELDRKSQSKCAKAESESLAIPPDSMRKPRPGFELFDVLLVLLGYFIAGLILSYLLASKKDAVKDSPILYFSGLIGKQTFVSLLIIILVWRRYPGGLPAFGLRSRKAIRTLVRAAGFFIAATGITLLLLEMTQYVCMFFKQEIQRHTILDLLSKNPSIVNKRLMIATAVIGAPLQEELLFRGILQGYFVSLFLRMLRGPKHLPMDSDTLQRFSVSARWLGIMAAAGLFALMHLPNWQHVPALFVLGLYLGYFYERYGNLLIPIFVHCMFNILPIAYKMWQVGPQNP
jgi:membrane protease YdiL (CAAX protease family)